MLRGAALGIASVSLTLGLAGCKSVESSASSCKVYYESGKLATVPTAKRDGPAVGKPASVYFNAKPEQRNGNPIPHKGPRLTKAEGAAFNYDSQDGHYVSGFRVPNYIEPFTAPAAIAGKDVEARVTWGRDGHEFLYATAACIDEHDANSDVYLQPQK